MIKRLILSSVLGLILISCKKKPPTPDKVSNDYEIVITIDGVTNKVQGALSNDEYWDFDNLKLANIPMTFSGLNTTSLVIADSINDNFIEGYPTSIGLMFDASNIGNIPVAISHYVYGSGYYNDKYPDLYIPTNPLNKYLVADTSIDWNTYILIPQYRPDANLLKLGTSFNLTDLGTNPNVILPDGFEDGDTLNQGEFDVEFGETQKGFMPKTNLYYPIDHSVVNGKDVITWSNPIEIGFSYKSFIRLY